MTPSYDNVFFIGVGRLSGQQGFIVVSHSYKSQTDLGAIKEALVHPDMQMVRGKHYSFTVKTLAWHLTADDKGLIYILICKKSYPQRDANICLMELQSKFTGRNGDIALIAKDNDKDLKKSCSNSLKDLCVKYDNLLEIDKLASVTEKVETVKMVMHDNIQRALENTVKVSAIEESSDALLHATRIFDRTAKELKNKMWWKKAKMWLIIGFIVAVILAIIIGVGVSYAKSDRQSS